MIVLELISAVLGGAKLRIAHSHNTTSSNDKLSILLRPILNNLSNVRIACGIDAGKWMFGKKKFILLKNGIDMKKYKFDIKIREEVRSELNLDGTLVIGHVGSFNYQKNHHKLIEVFREMKKIRDDIKLLLVGDGEERKNIEKLLDKYGIKDNVIMYGISNEVPRLMHAMDVFVMPSRFEGLPCVLIEAQSLGLPCIVSNKISIESKFGENIQYFDLNESNKVWADAILNIDKNNRKKNSLIAKANMNKCGYNINTEVLNLQRLYGIN